MLQYILKELLACCCVYCCCYVMSL